MEVATSSGDETVPLSGVSDMTYEHSILPAPNIKASSSERNHPTGFDSIHQQPIPNGVASTSQTQIGDATVADTLISHERLAFLRKTLGSNALAHREKLVDLVTTFSVLVVIIKLAATSLPWDVRMPAAFLLTGWSLVQVLLHLFHLCELDESAILLITKKVRSQRESLDGQWIGGVIAGITAISCLYVGYYAGFKNSATSIDGTRGSVYFLLQMPPVIFSMLAILAVIFGPGVIVVGVIILLLHRRVQLRSIGGIAFITFTTICVMFGVMSLWLSGDRGLGSTSSKVFMISVNILSTLGVAVLLWFIHMGPTRYTILYSRPMEHSNDAQLVVSISILMAIYVLVALLYSYDPAGTYKPSFLDVLG
jgi:hypothetical protein